MHQIFPGAEVKVKPMQVNGLNSDASKCDRTKLDRMLEDMFEEAEKRLICGWGLNYWQSTRLVCVCIRLPEYSRQPFWLMRHLQVVSAR